MERTRLFEQRVETDKEAGGVDVFAIVWSDHPETVSLQIHKVPFSFCGRITAQEATELAAMLLAAARATLPEEVEVDLEPTEAELQEAGV